MSSTRRRSSLSRESMAKSHYHPVFIRAGEGIKILGPKEYIDQHDQTLPLGLPIEFESPLFRGRILIRLKSIPCALDEANHKAYFEGRKRNYQIVVQGQFKEQGLTFSDLYSGDVYERPFKGLPSGVIMRWVDKFMQRINPGMRFQISEDRPKVLLPLGTVQEISVDMPGDEMDITVWDSMKENTNLMEGKDTTISGDHPPFENFTSATERRKKMSNPKVSSKYALETDKVYTFHYFDHTVDFGSYEQDLGFYKVDLSAFLDGQPLCMNALTLDERFMYRFEIWHEKLLEDEQEVS